MTARSRSWSAMADARAAAGSSAAAGNGRSRAAMRGGAAGLPAHARPRAAETNA